MEVRRGRNLDDKMIIALAGIIGVSAIETAALICGVDGQYLSVVVGAITTIVGFVFGVKVGEEKVKASIETP